MDKFELYDEHFLEIAKHQDYAWQFVDCYEAWCPTGWDGLTKELCDKINDIIPEEHRYKFTWRQFKQKFGGLCVYCIFGKLDKFGEPRPYTEEEREIAKLISEAMSEAEEKSYSICETCGKPGKTMTIKMYVTTRCKEHSKER